MRKYSIEDIARFAEHDMDAAERELFEESLRSDRDLQNELLMYQSVQSSLKMKLVEDDNDKGFKQTLAETSDEFFTKEAKVISLRRYVAWTSAVAAVFLVLMVWAPWRNDLYRDYANTEMLAVAERGDNADQNLANAVKSFNEKDFLNARKALENVSATQPDNSMVQYYYAITLIETDESDKARDLLQELYNGDSVYKYDAAFYIALSFVKEKNEEKAKLWLKKIPVEAAVSAKSLELLNKLE